MALYIFNIGCTHIPKTTHYFDKERTTTTKIHFAYYNQYKNGIDIAFTDNTLLFLSCAEAEKNLHTTPNSQRLIDNLAIDNPLLYAALALDCELQAWDVAIDANGVRKYYTFHTSLYAKLTSASVLSSINFSVHSSLFP